MNEPSPTPTLVDLQKKWDTDFLSNYLRHLTIAVLAAAVVLPLGGWWLQSLVGLPFTLAVAGTQLFTLPILALVPVKLSLGPRPNKQSFDENAQILAARQRRANLAATGGQA